MTPFAEYPQRSSTMKTAALALLGSACLIAFVGYLLTQSFLDTGPNCPGRDPDWIGWCDEAEVGQ